ncbi:MAG: hypothetical protein ABIQ18_14675 [Umezawaea sp.]
MTGLSVALEALRADAAKWMAAADAVDKPRAAIGDLDLTGVEMSKVADEQGLDLTYNHARTALEDMLSQAVQRFRDLGSSLDAAADTYQREDDQNMHIMDRLNP